MRRKFWPIWAKLLILTLAAGCLTGCGKTAEQTDGDVQQTQEAAGQTEEKEEESKPQEDESSLERTYTFDQLSIAISYDETHEIDENGALSANYTEQYGEICFVIPDDIDHSRIQKIVLNLASSEMKGLAIKMLKSETCYEESEQIAVGYETNMVERGSDLVSAANNFGVMGLVAGYAVKIDSVTFFLSEQAPQPAQIEDSLKPLKEAVTAEMGADFLMGAVLSGTTITDETVCELVKKHFNAVTLENELKPDALFDYSNTCSRKEMTELNGESFEVPIINYVRAENLLDKIYDWNQENPDNALKVRGHVLVWHSQTPEWFFHEEYNANKPYVSPDEMTKRQEWFIKTVLEHFTGEDSKYKELFYGWDVVNEAVSDSTGTYRKDFENSSWWAVYGSNEFIKNAFVFANKYAPADLKLFYNDYNDSMPGKVEAICQLLTDVKATPGARIDGFGMQAHGSTDESPTMAQVENAARAYAEIVDEIQFTEFDLKATKAYDGSEESTQEEYTKEAYRYLDFYNVVKKLKEDGISFTGWTVWGTIDKYSWLQSQANVGGGTDGSQKQCPLLFDDNYEAKPAYWALVDPSKLKPNIKNITVNQTLTEDYSTGKTYSFEKNETKASFIPVWDKDGIRFLITVVDKSVEDTDEVSVYASLPDGIKKETVLRKDAKENTAGYQAEITLDIPSESLNGMQDIPFDVVVTDGKERAAFNDSTLSHETSDEYFAKAQIRPYMIIQKGTAKIDGSMDDAFQGAPQIPLTMRLGAKVEATARLLWDEEFLYAYVEVRDDVLNSDNENEYEKDSFEIFIDENNHKSSGYEEDDKQYRVDYLNQTSFNGEKCVQENMESIAKEVDGGYVIEAKFKWTDLKPEKGTLIGIDLQINDADASGSRIGTLNWYDLTGQGWTSPAVYGEAKLTE